MIITFKRKDTVKPIEDSYDDLYDIADRIDDILDSISDNVKKNEKTQERHNLIKIEPDYSELILKQVESMAEDNLKMISAL